MSVNKSLKTADNGKEREASSLLAIQSRAEVSRWKTQFLSLWKWWGWGTTTYFSEQMVRASSCRLPNRYLETTLSRTLTWQLGQSEEMGSARRTHTPPLINCRQWHNRKNSQMTHEAHEATGASTLGLCSGLDVECPPKVHVLKALFPSVAMLRGGSFGQWLDCQGSDLIKRLINW